MLDVTFLVHGDQDSLYFVQPNTDRVAEDKGQLKRLGGSVNTTFHDHSKSADKEKVSGIIVCFNAGLRPQVA